MEKLLFSAVDKSHRDQAVEMSGTVVDAEVEAERSKVGRRDWYPLATKACRKETGTPEMSGNICEEDHEEWGI